MNTIFILPQSNARLVVPVFSSLSAAEDYLEKHYAYEPGLSWEIHEMCNCDSRGKTDDIYRLVQRYTWKSTLDV